MNLLEQLKRRNQELSDPEPIHPLDYDLEMDKTIGDLNQAGVSLMDYPPSTRHRAFVLEGKITQAANEERREDFQRLLSDWRNCFN